MDSPTLVTATEVISRLPSSALPIDPHEAGRLNLLLIDAEEKIEVEFAREGRDFRQELTTVSWLRVAAASVVREMVAAAIIIGPNVGVRSASSTTGAQSDTITFADVDSVGWAGIRLTDAQRKTLGLQAGSYVRGFFPPPPVWPEVMIRGRNDRGY